MSKLNKYGIVREDVLSVAKDLNFMPTEAQVEIALTLIDWEAEGDPTGNWNLWVENILYSLEVAQTQSQKKKIALIISNIETTKQTLEGFDLDELCDEISVMSCDDMADDFQNNLTNVNILLKGWYAVVSDLGIIAYFAEEKEAFRYRLEYINRILND